MGWAARQKRQAWANGHSVMRGNPAPAALQMRVIDTRKLAAAAKRKERLIARFSDRTYAIDGQGSLKRLPPSAHVPPVTEATIRVTPDETNTIEPTT